MAAFCETVAWRNNVGRRQRVSKRGGVARRGRYQRDIVSRRLQRKPRVAVAAAP